MALEVEVEDVFPYALAGWTRRYVLELAGWCKDRDLYTRDGETVGPLPNASRASPHRDELQTRYETRYRSGE